jgi:hypothetical protein
MDNLREFLLSVFIFLRIQFIKIKYYLFYFKMINCIYVRSLIIIIQKCGVLGFWGTGLQEEDHGVDSDGIL